MPEVFLHDMPNYDADDDPWPEPRIPFWKEHIIEKDMSDKIRPTHSIVDGFKHEVEASAVAEAFRKVVPAWQVLMFDAKYTCLPHSAWLGIIAECPTKGLKYSLPEADCNNFADCLKGWVKLTYWGINGIAWIGDFAGKHSFNCALCWNQPKQEVELLWIEPQRDLTFKLNSQQCYSSEGKGLVIL